jgi:hypothetical protein
MVRFLSMKVAATAWTVIVVDMDNGILLVVVAAQDKRVNSRSESKVL